jgi:hypothetical protein
MNKAFMRYVLGTTDGRRNTIGDAARLAKNWLVANGDDRTENKFQYVLLGDPALTLASPTLHAVIDSIGGKPVVEGKPVKLAAGSRVTVTGGIEGDSLFNGNLSVTVYDAEQTIEGWLNNRSGADTAIVFKDFTNVVYMGNHRVNQGRFKFSFTVGRDISYSDELAKMLVFASSDDNRLLAHGETRNFYLGSGSDAEGNEEGPTLFCYLDDKEFVDGGDVAQNALFVAEIYDEDGINNSGSGIGHDLELVIDGKIIYTYNLNSYLESDGDDYCQGVVRYQLPTLSLGPHKLRFRAWDLLNNSSKVTLNFNVIDPDGIVNVKTDRDDDGQATFFDAAGRRISGPVRAGKGLYLQRQKDGTIKKMMRTRQ